MIQVERQSQGWENPKLPGTRRKCCWGNEVTGVACNNEADVEFNICSGFRVVRYLCEGCLDLVLAEKQCTKKQE